MKSQGSNFDVVIIGSGVGGLTAAALLCRNGYRTLVVEKLPFVGGRAAALPYKGYRLPTGLIMMSDELHGALCREVGAEFEMRQAKGSITFRIDGKNFESPRTGIFKRMLGMAASSEIEAAVVYNSFRRGLAWCEPSRSMSLRDWLLQYTHNPKIIGFFNFWVAMNTGLRDFELPAGEFFRFFKELSFVKTFGFLPQAGGSFSEALAKAIRRDGGEIWTRSPAVAIDVQKGAAAAVTVKHDGEVVQIKSRATLCNAGPQATVNLVGREHFDPGTVREAASALAGPQIMVFVESDRPLLEGTDMLCPIESRRTIAILADSDLCPELAPEGKHLFEIVGFLSSSTPPYDFNSEVELCLLDAREVIPHFDDHARVLSAHFYHRTWGLMNVWAGHSLPFQTPIEGLYAIGDANGPSGWWGSTAAVKSGRLAVEDVMRRYQPAG